MNLLKAIVNNKVTTIVDVRSRAEFNSEHISGSKNIPLDEVADRLPEFQNMQKPVVLYCRSGNRSGMAISLLQQYGITNLFNGGSIDNMKTLMN